MLEVLHRQQTFPASMAFADEVIGFLDGSNRSGAMLKYLFVEAARQNRTTGQLNKDDYHSLKSDDAYYIEHEDAFLDHFMDRIVYAVGKKRPFVELGCGSSDSVAKKSFPLIEKLEPSEVFVNDFVSENVGDVIRDLRREHGGDTPIGGLAFDFMKASAGWHGFDNPAFFMLGATIGNLVTEDKNQRSEYAEDVLEGTLRHLANIAGKGADLIIIYDSNQNGTEHEMIYNTPEHMAFRKKIIPYVTSNIPTMNLQEDNFTFPAVWHSAFSGLFHEVYSNNDTTVSVAGQRVDIRSSRPSILGKSYKYSEDMMTYVAEKRVGLSSIDCFHLKPNQLSCNILRIE